MADPMDAVRTRRRSLADRWLGVGLATVIAVVTLVLGLSGRLTLYVSPETVWFACAAAGLTIAVAIWSCTLPLGAEEDHGHDHGGAGPGADASDAAASRRRAVSAVTTATGGVIASGVVLAGLVLPPASLSAELAMSRAGESTALFAGADDVTLGVADTSAFGVGDWAMAFATSTRPESYDGAPVTLTGFATPSESGELNLTRMVITHCVIDAQPASVSVDSPGWEQTYTTGEWIEVTGTVRADSDGTLRIEPASVKPVTEPKDPYEY